MEPYSPNSLPEGIRSRFVEDVNGLRMHVLEAGDPINPCLPLLHGFPELAYSWRKVMPALRLRDTMSWHPINAATDGRQAGKAVTTLIFYHSGFLIWCAMY